MNRSSVLSWSKCSGRCSTWSPIIEYLIAKIVNNTPPISLSAALTPLKKLHEEINTQHPVADMSDDGKIRRKIEHSRRNTKNARRLH